MKKKNQLEAHSMSATQDLESYKLMFCIFLYVVFDLKLFHSLYSLLLNKPMRRLNDDTIVHLSGTGQSARGVDPERIIS